MKILNWRFQYLINLSGILVCIICLFLILLSPLCANAEDIKDRMAECTKLDNDTARLKCFDDLSGRSASVKPVAPVAPVKEALPRETTAPSFMSKQIAPAAPVKEALPQETAVPSVMSKRWELDSESRKNAPLIRAHRSSYFLPVAYNSTPNKDAALDVDSTARAQNTEGKFQISFKIKLWEDVLNKDVDLWFGYTQLSFWQLYNSAFSSPFRETNYEPELLLNFRTNYDLLGLKGRVINVGVNHQSNGHSEPLSRSWNRVIANVGFEKDDFNLYVKTWYRIPENGKSDDNPDISTYMGYGELWGFYYWKGHRFGAMLRSNLRPSNSKGAVQLDWGFPFPFIKNKRFGGYIQYFNGYGESLVDYNANVNRISVGVILTDWN